MQIYSFACHIPNKLHHFSVPFAIYYGQSRANYYGQSRSDYYGQSKQNFSAKMQSRERNQNFRSHAIRGYCKIMQNYGRF